MSATDERAVWTAAFINDLPDSSFLYIEPGGSKDEEGKTTPRSLRHFPYKDAGGTVDMAHLRNALARIPQSNLPQSVQDAAMAKARRILDEMNNQSSSQSPDDMVVRAHPPRENLVRGLRPGVELRDDGAEGGMPTMVGRFAVFNEWSEINSAWEGRFLERIAPGAFAKTISENRAGMRVLFQHGRDPHIGDKPLGRIDQLREEDDGPHYEVPLFDTAYNRELLPGLEAGVYGSSFRFKVMREEFVKKPERSDHNSDGLPERTITEARVMEFGPVTFPAYEGATAGLRSLTDDYIMAQLFGEPERMREFLIQQTQFPKADVVSPDPAPSTTAADEAPGPERREPALFTNREEYLKWISRS